jgi:hypothetical protein
VHPLRFLKLHPAKCADNVVKVTTKNTFWTREQKLEFLSPLPLYQFDIFRVRIDLRLDKSLVVGDQFAAMHLSVVTFTHEEIAENVELRD